MKRWRAIHSYPFLSAYGSTWTGTSPIDPWGFHARRPWIKRSTSVASTETKDDGPSGTQWDPVHLFRVVSLFLPFLSISIHFYPFLFILSFHFAISFHFKIFRFLSFWVSGYPAFNCCLDTGRSQGGSGHWVLRCQEMCWVISRALRLQQRILFGSMFELMEISDTISLCIDLWSLGLSSLVDWGEGQQGGQGGKG